MESSGKPLEDRAWRGYDPRAAIPLVSLAALLSGLLMLARWYLDDGTAVIVHYAIMLALWPALLGLALYRAITYTYRLTDRALLIDRGFLNRPEPPIWLKDIQTLEPGFGMIGAWFGVGWLKVISAQGREVTLTALRDPETFARAISELIAAGEAKSAPESALESLPESLPIPANAPAESPISG